MAAEKKTEKKNGGAKKKIRVTKKKVAPAKKPHTKKTKAEKEQLRKIEKMHLSFPDKMNAAENWIKRKFCAKDECPHEKCIHHKFLHRHLMPLYTTHKVIPQASLLPWVEIYNQHKHGIIEGDADQKILIGFDDGKTRYDFALLEHKTEVGRLSLSQKEFLAEQILTKRVMVAVCHGYNDAVMFLSAYMKRKADGTNYYTAEQMKKFCFAGATTEESILASLPAKRVHEALGKTRNQRTLDYYCTKQK
jgi:hypothetical protein